MLENTVKTSVFENAESDKRLFATDPVAELRQDNQSAYLKRGK